MSKPGQNTFKGINTQAKASLLLFLLNLKDRGFDSVTLEDKEWEDFTLNFKSGKKIICESKDWSKALSWKDVKRILNKILKRKSKFNKADEVIIVCRSVNKELEIGIPYLKYSAFGMSDIYKKHGFTKEQTRLLARTSFFKIKSDRFLYQEALIYFADQIPYWVPVKDLEMFTDSVLVHDIYFKSEKGAVFTTAELREKIDDYKKRKIKASYAYDPQRKQLEEQLKSILSGLHNPQLRALILSSDALTALTAQPNNMFFLLDQVKKQKKVNLLKMDELWQALTKRLYAFAMLRILEKNIDSSENAEYVLGFIADNYKSFASPIRGTFNQEYCVDIANKIFEKHPDKVDKVFGLIKAVLKIRGKAYTKLENRRDYSRERELISKLLYKVYSYYQEKNDNSKIKEITNLIDKHFDLIDDDSRFVMFTPDEIFWILRDYINLQFENNFSEIVKLLLKQYQSHRWYKGKFSGWDGVGSGISQSGSQFSITDRHFISLTLKQSLEKYYSEKREKAWRFILENCITRKQSQVSKDKPDFLNRAAIPILIEEYRSGKHGKKAFDILSDFIKMRQGIPWKNDLIFRSINNDRFTDEQKWKLVKVSLEEFNNLPTNVFVEQIISDLAEKSKNKAIQQKAIKIIESWAQNPEYDKRHGIGSFDMVDNIFKLLNNKQTFNKGVEILQKHLDNPTFIKKTDTFDTYDVAKAIAKVIDENLKKGLELLESIYSYENLSINQQIVLCNGIYSISDNNPARLLQVYNQFLKPKLTELLGENVNVDKLTDIESIEKRFNHRYARELLVQFAEKLAKIDRKEHREAALWLVRVFIHDSDPPKDGGNYPDDPEGEFNKHKRIMGGEDQFAIRTVRGWCCHVIQKLAVPHSPKISGWTSDFIEKLVLNKRCPNKTSLMRLLAFDENFYVRLQSCIPLEQIVRNRHTHLPGRTTRFISQEAAEEIEKIVIDMIFNKDNQKLKAVMRNLARVFTYIRTLNTNQVNKTLKVFLDSEFDDVATEITPLLVFYALFRKDAFKNWPKNWEKPGRFDAGKFTLFEDQLKSGRPTVRAKLAWQLERLPDEIKNSPSKSVNLAKAIKLSAKYLLELANVYDHKVFSNIYRFVEEYIEDYFEICFKLWKKCIETESKYFKENWSEEKLHEMYWWPFFYNGKILVTVLKNRNEKEFLKWFGKLAKYPSKALIANDLDMAVEELINITDEEYRKVIEDLFKLLVQRNPKYYDLKQRWLENYKDE
ncbi:MAG: hypothetical protein ACTSQE_13930 [Candidatus Heimdallarchaeaceae archaeon]